MTPSAVGTGFLNVIMVRSRSGNLTGLLLGAMYFIFFGFLLHLLNEIQVQIEYTQAGRAVSKTALKVCCAVCHSLGPEALNILALIFSLAAKQTTPSLKIKQHFPSWLVAFLGYAFLNLKPRWINRCNVGSLQSQPFYLQRQSE